VAENGAPVAVVTWGQPEGCEMRAVLAAVGSLLPPPPPGASGPFALSAPGALEGLAERAGLRPLQAGDVATPFEYGDLDLAWWSIAASGPGARVIAEAGEQRAREIVCEPFTAFRQPDDTIRVACQIRNTRPRPARATA
jgi:hypothetical protein